MASPPHDDHKHDVRIVPKPDDASPYANRRANTRFQVELEVTLESESNFYMGFTENLSEGGLFVATHRVKPLGSKIDLTFKVPGHDATISVSGTVRWVREYSETTHAPPGMGIAFDRISSEDAHLVRQFLGAREPIFFDE